MSTGLKRASIEKTEKVRNRLLALTKSPGLSKVYLTILLAISYNAILAIINAHAMRISFPLVAATEFLVLLSVALIIYKENLYTSDLPYIYFFVFFFTISIIISILNQKLFIDVIRNMLIVSLFLLLGRRFDKEAIIKIFLLMSSTILSVLILELSALDIYAAIFKPAAYFANTRGVAEFSLDESGLFRNALGFEGRFSFGIFSTPRTSSIFLEQVSLANYAGVLSLFLLALWPELKIQHRMLHLTLILLIILSNNSRTSSFLFAICILGYFIYPRLPRYLNLAIAPIIVTIALYVFHSNPDARGDNFSGRVTHTAEKIVSMETGDYFGLSISQLYTLMDSGYPYIIYSSTIFGMVVYWLFVCLVIPQYNSAQRRCAYGLSTYTFINLLIGGTAIFSIKVAAPLWLLIGYMTMHHRQPSREVKPRIGTYNYSTTQSVGTLWSHQKG